MFVISIHSCRLYLQRLLFTIAVLNMFGANSVVTHPAAKRLYDDLLSDYNRLIRPSKNHSYKLTVNIGLKLSQLVDINWYDYNLMWRPADYGGVDMIHVPAENLWLPGLPSFY
ncbi:unnamed protein product, partial [Medioppia subpectinata]